RKGEGEREAQQRDGGRQVHGRRPPSPAASSQPAIGLVQCMRYDCTMDGKRNGGGGVAVVDASNVANSAPSARARLDYLVLVIRRLEEAGLRPIVVADAGLGRRIDDRDGYVRMVASGEIIIAPADM